MFRGKSYSWQEFNSQGSVKRLYDMMTLSAARQVLLETCLLLLFSFHGFTATLLKDVCKTCHQNATCVEKDNKYSCMCNFGLIGNGRTHCLDKDECQMGAHKICGEHTACHNTHGSYYCICLKGYRPSNNHENFIPNDGTFCIDIDECEDPDICGKNGKCKNIPKSYECNCKEGFTLQNGTGPFQANDSQSLCNEVNCGLPPSRLNSAMILSAKTTFGSQVTYSCLLGFQPDHGVNTSICKANGIWEGATVSCTAIDCGPPEAIPNTLVHTFSSTKFGSWVTFMCAKGFMAASGYNSSVCSDAGRWEGADLDCRVVDCGPPPSINYTKPDLLWNTTYGSTINFVCLLGFVMDSGNNTATCNENGKWVGYSIVCREIDCGQPPLIPNAEMEWNGASSLGSEVRYTCQKGFYNPKKWQMSRCTSHETWENITFSCKEVDCGKPFLIEHTDWIWNNRTILGSYVYYKCKPGFTDNGRKNFSACLENATWEELNLTCSVKEDLISNLIILNETCLQWQKSYDILGWKILYKFSIYGIRWNDKEFVDKKSLNYTTDNEIVCLDLLPETNYTVLMTAISPVLPAIRLNITVKTAMKQTFGDIVVLNKTCLTWTRNSSASRSPVVYMVYIQGRTLSSGRSLQSIMFNFSTDQVAPVLCLDLPLAAEYLVNITDLATEQFAYTSIHLTSDETENSTKEKTFNETCLWWNRSLDGLQEIYKLYVQGKKGYPKELFQDLLYKIKTYQNISAMCLDTPMDTVNVTEASSSLVRGEPIQNLTVFNESCLIWRRHFTSKELYVFFIYGYRRNEKSISLKLMFNVTTDEKQPVVCFKLHKGINYTVDVVSAFYPQFPEQIFIFTPNLDTPLPKLKIVPAHSQLPKISFQKSDRNSPISSYQVFVIQLVRSCSFTCESLEAVTYFNNISKTQGYATAELFPGDASEHLEFSFGDRQYYGEFYNAPLDRGKDYCIILRTITKMRTQTCTVMAHVEELSGSGHDMMVVLLGSIAFACFIVFMSYSLARCCNS